MNTARIDLTIAVCAGDTAAPVAVPALVHSQFELHPQERPRRGRLHPATIAEAGKRGSINAVRYGISTTMTTQKWSRGLGR
ncbi:hypothetical protein YH63_004400 [Afipia massiliensis]|uniref:Uncharacterized protein n=1 Tax=Afipia massiliensis TaxID=211460 RepID=A0A4U6BKI8_9BRAD|nr:hypothetical protein [Afipia massiliensis]TKT70712.1 hypothetical protein YH63_004400 [Afipia massiliensis]